MDQEQTSERKSTKYPLVSKTPAATLNYPNILRLRHLIAQAFTNPFYCRWPASEFIRRFVGNVEKTKQRGARINPLEHADILDTICPGIQDNVARRPCCYIAQPDRCLYFVCLTICAYGQIHILPLMGSRIRMCGSYLETLSKI